jgi:flagellar biosynthetic protein FliP
MTVFANENGKLADEQFEELKHAGKKKAKSKKTSALRVLLFFITVLIIISVIIALSSHASALTLEETLDSLLGEESQALKIIILLTLITLLPTLLIMLTGFTRIVIVLSMIRNAIGLQNMPPNSVIIGLSLFITFFVMSPALSQINEEAYKPYSEGEIKFEEFADKAMEPLRDFMLKQTYKTDLNIFTDLAGIEETDNLDDIPNRIVIVSFMTSELKHAFAIGFFLYIPFIVIDMIVASTLMSMGMLMLPPAMISMPFKILLFILVDGWQLTIGTLITSFGA